MTKRSHSSPPTSIPTNNPMSSTAQTQNVSLSIWPAGKILTTGTTPSSCHQSKNSVHLQRYNTVCIKYAVTLLWLASPVLVSCLSPKMSLLLNRTYDTTLDYFINVSTPCSSESLPVDVRLEVGVFASLCQYFSESEKQWRTDGMVPLAETNASRAVCRTKHLTSFAAGLFVPTNAISFKLPVSISLNTSHYLWMCTK